MTTALTNPVFDVGTIVDRVTFTADVTISATTEATAQSCASLAGFTADGVSNYWLDFYSPGAFPGASVGATINFYVYLDGSPISAGHSLIGQVANPTAASFGVPVFLRYFAAAPAAGTRTFDVRASRGVANGTVRGNTVNLGLVGYLSVMKAS